MFHDGKVLVKGHAKVIEMVKSREYAYVENKLTLQNFVAEDFSTSAVCNYYLCQHSIAVNFGLAFPVGQ